MNLFNRFSKRQRLIRLVQKYQKLEEKRQANIQKVNAHSGDGLDKKIKGEEMGVKNNRIKRCQAMYVREIIHIAGKGEIPIPELGIVIEPIIDTLAIWEPGQKPRYLR